MRRRRVRINQTKSIDAAGAANKAIVLAFLQAAHNGRRRAPPAQLDSLLRALLPHPTDTPSEPPRRGRWGTPHWCTDPGRWRATFDKLYYVIEEFVDPETAERFEATRQLALSVRARRAAGSHANSERQRAGNEAAVLTVGVGVLADLASGRSIPSLSEAMAAARALRASGSDTGKDTARALMHEEQAVLAASTELSLVARSVVGGRVEEWLMNQGWGLRRGSRRWRSAPLRSTFASDPEWRAVRRSLRPTSRTALDKTSAFHRALGCRRPAPRRSPGLRKCAPPRKRAGGWGRPATSTSPWRGGSPRGRR
jgi:hypothetical protein